MPVTTSFDEFLTAEGVDEDDYGAVQALHCVTIDGGGEPEGSYSAEMTDRGQMLVRGWSETQLLLVSHAAREAFRRLLEGFATGDGFPADINSWVGYRQAMDNPNA